VPAGNGHAIATFTGHGIKNTAKFTIGGTGNWALQYSYDCKAFGVAGNFIVFEDGGRDLNGVHVNELSKHGHGIARASGDAGRHYLAIDSECAWQGPGHSVARRLRVRSLRRPMSAITTPAITAASMVTVCRRYGQLTEASIEPSPRLIGPLRMILIVFLPWPCPTGRMLTAPGGAPLTAPNLFQASPMATTAAPRASRRT
jgi:hypothetical protein